MPAWLTEIGSRLGGLFGNRTPSSHFGAFGKHPGWDDHLDDLGLDSEPLIAAKQYLYVQGIGGVIDAGQWEALPPGDVLPEFRHTFLWLDDNDILVGKLWSSSDGKGRTKYPMVVCSHFANRSETGIPDIVPVLDRLEQSCRATKSADDVRRLVAEAGQATAQLLNSPAVEMPTHASYAQRIGLDPNSEVAARIPYFAENQFAGLAGSGVSKTGINLKLGQFKGAPQHIRVPADGTRPLAAQQFWQDFLVPMIPAGAPRLYIAPGGSPWLDVIVGLPTPKHLFCLRAGEKAMPLASAIPFTLTEASRAKAAACWQKFLAES